MSDYDDDDGLDVFYLLSAFFALGIWLVFSRYQTIHNRAVPFRHPAPDQIGPRFSALKILGPNLESHLRYAELRPPFMAEGRRYITSYDPATAYHIGTYLADSETEITEKIMRATQAQKQWKTTTFRDRKRVVRSLKKWLVDNQETCAKVACRDTGKTLLDAALGEILVTCAKMDWLINHGEGALKPETRHSSLLMCYKTGRVHYEPLGVVAAIVSWNYPLHSTFSTVLAALFAGNAIVVKCSEHVVWSSMWFVGAIKECLRACKQDPELVQLVCCYPEDAEVLTRSPFIKHITFIGSEDVGRKVAMAATQHLTPCTLELGGKDPAIIMENTDLQRWISVLMRAFFQNSGQNCVGLERIIVHSSQYEELYAMMAERAMELRPGSALAMPDDGFVPVVDCGAMINTDRLENLQRIISNARDAGVQIDGEGKRRIHPYLEEGAYFGPTVVGNPDPFSEIAQAELFAPVVVIMKYDTIDEAIDLANGTKYGLGASVFGPDQDECVKVAKRLECGMVRSTTLGCSTQDLPFGGTKMSGYGRMSGPEGLRALTNPKAIVTDRFAWLVQTSIPKVVDYPIRSAVQSWAFMHALVEMFYADGWRTRIRALSRVLKTSGR
ncbi:meiotic sister-chromatid recombination aldehyde dehydrogenase [Amylocystis lapponica]|nr:meiotic sister-chromatid recombination aldehyde dehydrogenase [Amylocystis lapponica]